MTRTISVQRKNNISTVQDRTALILGGWSPGPFYYLESYLEHDKGYRLVRPALEMPPMTIGWCCQWQVILLLSVYAMFLWFMRQWCRRLRRQDTAWPVVGAYLLILVATVLWFRILVALAVHSSIQSNVKKCRQLIEDYNISLVLGFSWGGAVAAELLVDRKIAARHEKDATIPTTPIHNYQERDNIVDTSQRHGISFLLMAPTTSVVASLDWFQPRDASLRVSSRLDSAVVVVHASNDAAFCPHAERWRGIPSVEWTVLRDNHVFLRPSSERALKEIVNRLIIQQ